MTSAFDALTYRLIASRYPTTSVYDRITNATDFAAILQIEALTNPRVREELGDWRKIRAGDIYTGPNATAVMASFVYSGPGRFTDGTFGVYYAALDEETSIAESLYHTERFLRATAQPSIDVDKRMYRARITGSMDDIRGVSNRSRLYDRNDYAGSSAYAARLYEKNVVDGIWYRSVRRPAGECVAAFRPHTIAGCRMHAYLQFRWNGTRIVAVAHLSKIRETGEMRSE